VLEKKARGAPAAVGLEETSGPGRWLAQTGGNCPVCGEPARNADDVIDELTEVVIDSGGTVEHVYAEIASGSTCSRRTCGSRSRPCRAQEVDASCVR
jgi:hypothetical protein